MTFSLLRTWCLILGRLFFVWPALLTGGVMLVMAFLSHQGGVASRLDYYTYEATRWRNAPEGEPYGAALYRCRYGQCRIPCCTAERG